MSLIKEFQAGKLTVKAYSTKEDMGKAAAILAAEAINKVIAEKGECNVIFAAAPSQDEFLENLISIPVNFGAVNAFHMDEYIGLPSDAPQGFGNFLKRGIFDKVDFKSVNYIIGNNDPKEECERYSALLKANPVDVVCMGIGENGHIAFNDPHVAFFDDKEVIKVVDLDEKCRNQQVNDGCFSEIGKVPTHALTLTIPTLVSARNIYCMVPRATKAEAVFNTVNGGITEECPSTILKNHDNAIMFIDSDSGSRVI